jgi:hypothetical protein
MYTVYSAQIIEIMYGIISIEIVLFCKCMGDIFSDGAATPYTEDVISV